MKRKLSVMFIIVFLIGIMGCAGMQTGDVNTQDLVLQAMASTIGGGLGIIAVKDPVMREKIETYYKTLATGDLTPAMMNAALASMKTQSDAMKVLAGNIIVLAKELGVSFNAAGEIMAITDKVKPYVAIGKEAYLLQIQLAGLN